MRIARHIIVMLNRFPGVFATAALVAGFMMPLEADAQNKPSKPVQNKACCVKAPSRAGLIKKQAGTPAAAESKPSAKKSAS